MKAIPSQGVSPWLDALDAPDFFVAMVLVVNDQA